MIWLATSLGLKVSSPNAACGTELKLKPKSKRQEGTLLWKAVLSPIANLAEMIITVRTVHEAYDMDAAEYLTVQIYERIRCQSTTVQISKQEFAALGLSSSSDGSTLRNELLCRIVVAPSTSTISLHHVLFPVGSDAHILFVRDPAVRRINNFLVSAAADAEHILLNIYYTRNLRAWSTKISRASLPSFYPAYNGSRVHAGLESQPTALSMQHHQLHWMYSECHAPVILGPRPNDHSLQQNLLPTLKHECRVHTDLEPQTNGHFALQNPP